MRYTVHSIVTAFAIALLVPFAAEAQAPKPRPAPLMDKFHIKPVAEARWNKMIQAAMVLNQEGAEVHRINPAEHKQIADFINSTRAFIAKAKQGGISEAEEDSIDNNMAEMFLKISQYMSDPVRKKPLPMAPKK